MLADNPHVLRRLRQEILSVLGSEQAPTFEHVREMKYLRAVINGEVARFLMHGPMTDRRFLAVETLRLYPPV